MILHGLFAVVAFGGFIISIVVFSFKIARLNVPLSRQFIINGIIPLTSVILYFLEISPLTEWIMLLSVILSLIPIFRWNTFQK